MVGGAGAEVGVGGGVEATVAVSLAVAVGLAVWGIVVSSTGVGVAGGAGGETGAGFVFGAGSVGGMASVGATIFPVVILSFVGVLLLLLGRDWAGSIGSGLRMVLLSIVSGLKKYRKVSLLFWLSSSRTKVKIAFLKIFRVGVETGVHRREKACLTSCV